MTLEEGPQGGKQHATPEQPTTVSTNDSRREIGGSQERGETDLRNGWQTACKRSHPFTSPESRDSRNTQCRQPERLAERYYIGRHFPPKKDSPIGLPRQGNTCSKRGRETLVAEVVRLRPRLTPFFRLYSWHAIVYGWLARTAYTTPRD